MPLVISIIKKYFINLQKLVKNATRWRQAKGPSLFVWNWFKRGTIFVKNLLLESFIFLMLVSLLLVLWDT